MQDIQKVGHADIEGTESTPGLPREMAFDTEHLKMVRAEMDGNDASGWHHHGDHHNYVYFVSGQAHVEFGPNGEKSLDFEAGDYMYVPPRVVHRDNNPADAKQVAILSLVGDGPWVVNVDGPADASDTDV